MNTRDINIGIVHTTYLKRGGEDKVAESEYLLLKSNHFNAFYLKFKNPEGTVRQLVTYLFSVFNLYSFIKCCRWLRRNKIDVLHVHNWFFAASPAVFWAARYCNVPVIMTMHNYRMICPTGTLSFNGKPYYGSLYKSFSWDAIKKGVYRNSSLLTFILVFTVWLNKKIGTWKAVKKYIILTEHSKVLVTNSHLNMLADKLVVKPNFVAPVIAANPGLRQQSFLFVGRLSDEKGIKLLLAAFKNTRHQLTIIGEGPLEYAVEEYMKANSNVTYLGFKGKEAIADALHTCSALIFPSIWYETFGLIMIEAFAAGIPVIASDCGSSSVIVQNGYNGLHFDKSRPENLRAKLDEWSGLNEEVKSLYRKNAYATYLQKYTPEKNVAQLTEIYRQAVELN